MNLDVANNSSEILCMNKSNLRQSVKETKMNCKLIGMLLFSVLIPAAPAFAGDGKTLPATMCEGATAAERGKLLKNVTGILKNENSSSTVYVTCPGVRDIVGGKSGGIEYSYMNYKNRYGGRGYCRLMSMGQDGTIYSYSTRSMVATSSARTLTFGKLNTKTGGTNLIYCTLPGQAELITYRIDERS